MTSTEKILAVMFESRYPGIELVGPLLKLETAGYSFDFVTPRGERSPVLPPSTERSYVDPPLGVCVTTAEDAALVNAFEATSLMMSARAARDAMRGSGNDC